MILRLHQLCVLHTTEPNSPYKVRLTLLETNLVFQCLGNTPFWLQIVKCKESNSLFKMFQIFFKKSFKILQKNVFLDMLMVAINFHRHREICVVDNIRSCLLHEVLEISRGVK